MLVRRWGDVEEYDLGSILGKPELGVKVKRLSHREKASNSYNHCFDMEYYLIEPGKAYPVHRNQRGMVNFVLSGVASFVTETSQIKAQKGDVVYTGNGELQYISNNSSEQLEIMCYIDCQNPLENCKR